MANFSSRYLWASEPQVAGEREVSEVIQNAARCIQTRPGIRYDEFSLPEDIVNDWEYEGSASEYLAFIDKIEVEFWVRFCQFQAVDKIVQLIKSPLEAKPDGNGSSK